MGSSIKQARLDNSAQYSQNNILFPLFHEQPPCRAAAILPTCPRTFSKRAPYNTLMSFRKIRVRGLKSLKRVERKLHVQTKLLQGIIIG